MCSRTGSRSLRVCSGSRSAMSSMELLRSAKSTVTCLRSPSMAGRAVRIFSARCRGVYASGEAKRGWVGRGVSTASPHCPQKRTPSTRSAPQLPHCRTRRAPHWVQKREASAFSHRHRGQCMATSREGRRGSADDRDESSAASEEGSTILTPCDPSSNVCAMPGPKRVPYAVRLLRAHVTGPAAPAFDLTEPDGERHRVGAASAAPSFSLPLALHPAVALRRGGRGQELGPPALRLRQRVLFRVPRPQVPPLLAGRVHERGANAGTGCAAQARL